MAGEKDDKFLEEIGLAQLPMMQNRGAVAAEKFDQILDTFKPSNTSVNHATKAEMAKTLNTWIHLLMPDQKSSILDPKLAVMFDLIGELAISTDDGIINANEEYVGNVYIASELASLIGNYSIMDFSGGIYRQHCQKSFDILESVLVHGENNPDIQFTSPPMLRHKTPADYRSEICQILVRYMPSQGNFELANGMKVISLILTPKNRFPLLLLNAAKSSLNILTTNAKSSLAHSTRAILDLVKLGGNDTLLTSFMSMPELYTNDPEAVHENLSIFFKQPYMQYAYLFSTIAAKSPQVLIPHLTFFIDQLVSTPMVGTITLMTLENLAKYDANLLYTKTSIIVEKSKNVANGTVILAKVLAAIGLADNAADNTILLLVDLLEASASDQYAAPGLLAAISNVMTHMSNVDILAKQISRIEKFKHASEISFTAIKDFAAGRSLETLTNRVDEMEARITQMNHKIAETCTNMADVIAYVDANMADMKDFIAEVVKKLPNPKRLEVVGTLRKTLVLHFECCRTGLEYPIISHEWSKWLKMGFSLIKAGKAVIDIGMGNPLGLLATGITAVQEIYEAYKTNDDDEFNTYITEPFLTSAEQDQLINKLRDQGFFEIFGYDAQKGGWYLINPEKDGRRPEGDAGSVTKVWRKEGYGGVAETVLEVGSTLVMGYINSGGEMDQMESTESILSGENAVTLNTGKKSDSDSTKNPIVNRSPQGESKDVELRETSSKSPPSNYQSGGRAQAMKEKMNATTVATAEASVKEASKTAEYYAKVDDYEKRIRTLEVNVTALQGSLEELRNQRASCACIIS